MSHHHTYYVTSSSVSKWDRMRGREKERESEVCGLFERGTERERRESARERDRDSQTEGGSERERERETHTDRQTDRQTEETESAAMVCVWCGGGVWGGCTRHGSLKPPPRTLFPQLELETGASAAWGQQPGADWGT